MAEMVVFLLSLHPPSRPLIPSLTLEWNCIGIWETGIGALADAFQVNSCLQELDLRNNKINPQGGVVLAGQLKHNTSLKRLGKGVELSVSSLSHTLTPPLIRFAMELHRSAWWTCLSRPTQVEQDCAVPGTSRK